MKTLMAAGPKPLIIVRGSGRAAQFVDDWVKYDTEIREQHDAGASQIKIDTLKQMQLEGAEESIRRDLAAAKATSYDEHLLLAASSKAKWWDVAEYIDCLKKLGAHNQLHFFDIRKMSAKEQDFKSQLNPSVKRPIDFGLLRAALSRHDRCRSQDASNSD
eukprot:SAG11_NODE_1040_length_6065_cov_2.701307_8_plen_160_part_00